MEIQGKATKAAFYVMLATFLSKILGFLREILLGSRFGTTYVSDAYLVAITIPTIIFASIAGALATTYIPIYSKVRVESGEENSLRFTNNVLNFTVIVGVGISILGMLFAGPIVSFIAMGFNEQTLDLAVSLTRIIFPMVIFIGLAYIFSGYLQSNNQFVIPALMNVPNNIIIIVALMLSSYFGVYGLIYATLFGAIFQFVIQYPFARKKGYKYNLIIDKKDENIKKVAVLAVPVLIGTAVQQVNALVDRMLASGLFEGSIAALNFANKLNGFVYGIFSLSIATVIYPLFSSLNARNDNERFKQVLASSLNIITILMLPIMVGTMVLDISITSVLFERGAFDARSTELTASALFFYALGMVFYGYRDVLNRAFFSFHDTKTPMYNGAMAVIVNIILNLILVRYMYHSGLALATSISSIITTILLFFSLRKSMGSIGGRQMVSVFIKASIAASIMGIVVYFVNNYLMGILNGNSIMEALNLFISISLGAFVYLVIILFMNIREISWFIGLIKTKTSSRL